MKRLLALVVLTPLAVACGSDAPQEGDLPEVDCNQTIPRFGEVAAFNIDCRNCHDSALDGSSRRGAPVGIDYDIYSSAVMWAEETASTVYVGSMPVETELRNRDKTPLYLWSLCGTPQ
ncbi:MAG: hypothetical protein KBG28_28660 [Kofleriaceae bacterium]|jgi:hypothetical protein|nr:hypothetical protein [Kofleriaceae bacterium]MBP6838553.1 hypothetical protein [Kofleriaceae bacterium]MBP9207972.1 hypothetical protein [Kofleriaceae bacterium]